MATHRARPVALQTPRSTAHRRLQGLCNNRLLEPFSMRPNTFRAAALAAATVAALVLPASAAAQTAALDETPDAVEGFME